MGAINIDGKLKERISRVNLKSALSMFRLAGRSLDEESWVMLTSELRSLHNIDAIGGPSTEKILSHLPEKCPEFLLRRDPGLWDAAIYFAVDRDIFSICSSGPGTIQMRAKISGTEVFSDGFISNERTDKVFSSVEQMVSRQISRDIGKKNYLALWVSRGYDTLQRVSQILQLRERHGSQFLPNILVLESGNLIDAENIFPFANSIIKIENPQKWREGISASHGLAECIKFDWNTQNDFHKGIVSLIQGQADFGFTKDQDKITIIISLEAEKRQMINQEEFFNRLISKLSSKHNNLRILVNGMTGNVENIDFFKDIRDFESKIINRLAANHDSVVFEHMHGATIFDKAKIYSTADFFVAPIGTAALVPQVLGIPGVVYNSPAMMQQIKWFLDVMPSRAILLPMEMSHQIDEDMAIRKYSWGWTDNSRGSYALDIDDAVNFCIERFSQEYR